MNARQLQAKLDEAQRALASTRASLDARLSIALTAIASVACSRADRDVVDAASVLFDEPLLRADRVLFFVEPRRLALSAELADVDASAAAAEARRLVDESAVTTDVGDARLLLSQAARQTRLSQRRLAAEQGLQQLDADVLRYCHGIIVHLLSTWLTTSPQRFDEVVAQLPPSARGVVRSARVVGGGRRYLDAIVARTLTPQVHAVAGLVLQQQVDGAYDGRAGSDVDAGDVDAAIAVVAACAAAVDGFNDYDAVSEDDVLWDFFFADVAGAGDGSFVDEVKQQRAAQFVDKTSADVDATLVLAEQPNKKKKKPAAPRTAVVDDEGSRLGRYTLLRRLGSGGMAEVWLARQDGPRGFQKEVVVKRILADHAGDPYFIGLFQKEASVIAGLQHPNLIHVYDLGVEGDRWFMAMERLRGKSLLDLARALQPFPVDVAARVAADAARGLAYAHARPVVHRDISPDNLFVTDSGLTKVIDFGVAKAAGDVTSNSALKGKVPYMAPEVFRGDAFDGAVDVFALGVTLYLVLVGKRPFTGTLPEIMRAIVSMTTPPRPSQARRDLPPALDALIAAMLSPQPAQRPSAAAVDATLSTWAAPMAGLTALVTEPALSPATDPRLRPPS